MTLLRNSPNTLTIITVDGLLERPRSPLQAADTALFFCLRRDDLLLTLRCFRANSHGYPTVSLN